MNIQQFLAHHGVALNPFADEDAQTDPVFKEHCRNRTRHPSWDKIYGDPGEPATSIVFGEKGAGKTALRLQMIQQIDEHNRKQRNRRLFVIEYDDFNPFLDHFSERISSRRRRSGKVLGEWKLWDHMDAILALGVTKLVDRILGRQFSDVSQAGEGDEPIDTSTLDRHQARDLLLLAACYDQSMAETFKGRWQRLRRKLHFRTWRAQMHLALGLAVTVVVLGTIATLRNWDWLGTPWPYLLMLAGWIPCMWRTLKWYRESRRIVRQVRVVRHEASPLRKVLLQFTGDELTNQPLPNRERTDDRYELLFKFQNVLKTLGYSGVIVVVDRVDEPHLINGSAEKMRDLLWPMLDNKFLKHPGIGFKLLLPIELSYYIDREDREFYQRARLDKQNLIPSLQWTGEALYDLANSRLQACAAPGQSPSLRSLFDEQITDRRLITTFQSLRVPRHLFKFIYRLLVAHCSSHTDSEPAWTISPATFESTLAVYQRDQDAFDRGLGAG